MHPIQILSAAAQVAAYLRAELERGHWLKTMPGVGTLSSELGVNHKTVEAALRQLESEGLLVGQGAGRKRRIELPDRKAVRPMRIAILLYEAEDRFLTYLVELHYSLVKAGHTVIMAAS